MSPHHSRRNCCWKARRVPAGWLAKSTMLPKVCVRWAVAKEGMKGYAAFCISRRYSCPWEELVNAVVAFDGYFVLLAHLIDICV